MEKRKFSEIQVDNEKVKKVVLYLAAFLIPILVVIEIFIYLKIYPFGDDVYLLVDANGQYSAYLQYFRDVFYEGNSIFYSLGKVIGGEMYGLFTYYLVSPFNFIVCLLPDGYVNLAMELIIVLKMGACSLSLTYYLNRKKKVQFTNIIFALCYSFSAYVLTYGFNIMWMDGVILLPLILIGIEKIIEDKNPFFYTVCLCLAMITNYYIGFMICIFSVLYFAYKLSIGKIKGKQEILKRIGVFILFSIIAAMIAAIILIPSFTSIQGGRADFTFSDLTWDKNFNVTDIFSKFFTKAFSFEEIENDSMPPLFCGVLINILVIFYFLNSKIKLKEKIITILMFAIFFVSFYIDWANLLWSIGNAPAWWEYRYGFCFVLFFILLAKKSFDNFKEGIDIKRSIIAILIYIAVGIFALNQNTEIISKSNVIKDIVSAAIFVILLNLTKIKLKKEKIRKYYIKIIFVIIFALSIYNLIDNACFTMDILQEKGGPNITQGDLNFLVNIYSSAVEEIRQYDDGLYRLEKSGTISLNDSLMFNYNGMSFSGSTYSEDLHLFMKLFGLNQYHVKVKYDVDTTKTVDMLFGVKYLINVNSNAEYKEYTKLEKQDENAIYDIYQNQYALSLGFSINANALAEIEDNQNTFEYQNNVLKALTGFEENVYTSQEGEIIQTTENMEETDGIYEKVEDEEEGKIIFKFTVESTDNIYVYLTLDSDYGRKADLYINGEESGTCLYVSNNDMINLGKREIGEEITLELVFETNEVNMGQIYVYYEQEEILAKYYEELSKEEVNFSKISNTKYVGTINIESENEYVMFTIPYDEGWNITVDRRKSRNRRGDSRTNCS